MPEVVDPSDYQLRKKRTTQPKHVMQSIGSTRLAFDDESDQHVNSSNINSQGYSLYSDYLKSLFIFFNAFM